MKYRLACSPASNLKQPASSAKTNWTAMTQKAKESNAAQYQKFKEAARKLETDESEENFDRAVKRIAVAPPKPKDESRKKA